MPNRIVVALKVLVHVACLAAFVVLIYYTRHDATHPDAPALLGPDPTATLSQWTGYSGLRILLLSLVITPLRRLSPRLAWLVRFRRMLGLYAFFYICLHLIIYLKLYANLAWPTLVDDLSKRHYIIVGFAAWLLLLPLALTSTKWAIRKLGRNWQRLHRLTYAAAVLGIVHYWWIVKPGVMTPLPLTLVLAALLAARPLWRLADARRRQRRATAAA
jgi:sulfoxide reductase heme-binding subunit YedZ